ncbi:arsenate reductase [Pseudomonas aeruginosa]|nr:arsenate reductase [Pseudomonas aeruginosa]
MSELILLHNPRCSKSRAALELLEARGLQPQVVRYLETPPSAAELKAILAKLGIPARQLLRDRGGRIQGLGLDEPSLGEEGHHRGNGQASEADRASGAGRG